MPAPDPNDRTETRAWIRRMRKSRIPERVIQQRLITCGFMTAEASQIMRESRVRRTA